MAGHWHSATGFSRTFNIVLAWLCIWPFTYGCKDKPQSAQLPSSQTELRYGSDEDSSSGGEDGSGATESESSGNLELPSLPPGWPSASIVAAANLDRQGDDETLSWNGRRMAFWHQGEEQSS